MKGCLYRRRYGNDVQCNKENIDNIKKEMRIIKLIIFLLNMKDIFITHSLDILKRAEYNEMEWIRMDWNKYIIPLFKF